MVQKGYAEASTPRLVRALKMVDFPTLGKPMSPHLKPIFFSTTLITKDLYKFKMFSFVCQDEIIGGEKKEKKMTLLFE